MVLWGLRQAGWVCKHYSSFWQNGYEGENTVVRTRRCSDCCADLTSIPGPMKRDPFAQLFALAKPILSEYAKICYIYIITPISTFGGCSWVKQPITDLIKYLRLAPRLGLQAGVMAGARGGMLGMTQQSLLVRNSWCIPGCLCLQKMEEMEGMGWMNHPYDVHSLWN